MPRPPVLRSLAPPLALVLLLTPLAGSCSFVAMKRLPSTPDPNEAPDCTSSWTPPLADFSAAVLTGSTAVLLHSAASTRENQGKSGTSLRTSAWVATGLALAFIVSGAYGAHQRSRCTNAQRLYGPREKPAWYEEAHPTRGTAGARCTDDKDCNGDLICDTTMKTCVEANPTPAPSPPPRSSPPAPPAPAGSP